MEENDNQEKNIIPPLTMEDFNNYLLMVVESKAGLRRKIIAIEKYIKTIKNESKIRI